MKSNRILVILLATVLLTSSATSLWAEDWKTIDGKVYQDVKVIESAPDAVTILHKDGGALVPLELLPPELQKRFNYDPAKAKVAADERMQEEITDARALRAERDQLASLQKDEDEETVPDASATNDSHVPSAAPATSASTHHSVDELFASASTMRRDLSDPTYHTMAHLASSIHSLGPDPSDPNHHSMSEIADSGL